MKNLYIIDAYNLIYRMFYAIPEMHTRDGHVVNALFGVVKFLKSLSEMSPDDSIIIASESGSNFRSTLFAEYKGTRDRMPDNLRSQLDMIFDFFEKADIPVLIEEGYEADDIIGSLCHALDLPSFAYDEIIIISSDKDLCQFVRDGKVRIFDAMKQKNLREADVIEKFGVPASQVVDYLSIVGDSSDNIPGISGFGPKKAVDLLSKYNTLEGIYEHIDELTPKMQDILRDQKENAFLSKQLATIVTTIDIASLSVGEVGNAHLFEKASVIELLKKYEFKSLIPLSHREEQKTLTPKISSEIVHTDTFSSILDIYKQVGKIYITTDSQYIFFQIQEQCYKANPSFVEISDFFERLFILPGQVVGYDLKDDLKKIFEYKKSLSARESQGRLF